MEFCHERAHARGVVDELVFFVYADGGECGGASHGVRVVGEASEEITALGKFFRKEGLYTLVRWNTFFTNPPLCITEKELREGFAIIDRALEITDKAVVG